MIIRKLFKYENAHIVRNCSSERCSHSIHGHGFLVELFFTADKLDNGMMIMDFGLMKGNIKDIIDSFDHALTVWDKDKDLVEIAKKSSDRYVILPMSSSAEAQAILFFKIIKKMLKKTKFNNGEKNVRLVSVRIHETDTGYAEAFEEDLKLIDFKLKDIEFSEQIKREWKDSKMWDKLLSKKKYVFKNSKIKQQV